MDDLSVDEIEHLRAMRLNNVISDHDLKILEDFEAEIAYEIAITNCRHTFMADIVEEFVPSPDIDQSKQIDDENTI